MSNEITNLMTRGQLTDAAADLIQDTSANRKAMIRVALDMGFREALQRYDWPGLIRWVDAAVVVAANEAYFHAPEEVRSLLAVVDSTAPFVLDSLDIGAEIHMTQGFVTLSGGPVAYAHVGDVGINARFSAATPLEIVSDGADTRTVWIAGFQGIVPVRSSFVLTGTTAVSVGSWDDVTELSAATTDTVRSVTLRGAGAGTVYSVIRPNTFHTMFKRYRLAAVPGQVTTLRLIFRYTPPPVFNDAHVYPLPIQNYLMEFAVAMSYQSRRQQDFAVQHFELAEAFLLSAMSESERGRIRISRPNAPRPRQRFVQASN